MWVVLKVCKHGAFGVYTGKERERNDETVHWWRLTLCFFWPLHCAELHSGFSWPRPKLYLPKICVLFVTLPSGAVVFFHHEMRCQKCVLIHRRHQESPSYYRWSWNTGVDRSIRLQEVFLKMINLFFIQFYWRDRKWGRRGKQQLVRTQPPVQGVI